MEIMAEITLLILLGIGMIAAVAMLTPLAIVATRAWFQSRKDR
jgi:hypothetical protein